MYTHLPQFDIIYQKLEQSLSNPDRFRMYLLFLEESRLDYLTTADHTGESIIDLALQSENSREIMQVLANTLLPEELSQLAALNLVQDMPARTEQEIEEPPVLSSGYEIVTGKDTYVRYGKSTTQVEMKRELRNKFFAQYPDIAAALLEHHLNPLSIPDGADAREGEAFITYPLIERIIWKNFLEKQGQGKYQFSQLLMAGPDDVLDIEQLPAPEEMTEKDQILVAVVEKVHAMSAYIFHKNGQTYIFGFDTQGVVKDSTMLMLLRIKYPDAKVCTSDIMIQDDYFSCSTFAIKALSFFAKYGSTLLDYGVFKTQLANYNDLPPKLLKLSQYQFVPGFAVKGKQLPLDKTKIDSIVSEKKGLTLKGYQERYQVPNSHRFYSSAAVDKKYKLLESLDETQTATTGHNG